MTQHTTMARASIPYNREALNTFVKLPVTPPMIEYLARQASMVIDCDDHALPSSFNGKSDGSHASTSIPPLPPVKSFIYSLVCRSHVHTPILMTSLVYLARLREKLPPTSKGMRCTVHRIFLAALILAAKNVNDFSPKNKYWARYTAVDGYNEFGFSVSEVNLMERQMLSILNWDMRVTEEDLLFQFEPFLAQIRTKLQAEEEQKIMARKIAANRISQQISKSTGRNSRFYSKPSARPTSINTSPPSVLDVPHLSPEHCIQGSSRSSSRTRTPESENTSSPSSTISTMTTYTDNDVQVVDSDVSPSASQAALSKYPHISPARPPSAGNNLLAAKNHHSSIRPHSLISRIFGGAHKRGNRTSVHA